jgi:hypothetical protein
MAFSQEQRQEIAKVLKIANRAVTDQQVEDFVERRDYSASRPTQSSTAKLLPNKEEEEEEEEEEQSDAVPCNKSIVVANLRCKIKEQRNRQGLSVDDDAVDEHALFVYNQALRRLQEQVKSKREKRHLRQSPGRPGRHQLKQRAYQLSNDLYTLNINVKEQSGAAAFEQIMPIELKAYPLKGIKDDYDATWLLKEWCPGATPWQLVEGVAGHVISRKGLIALALPPEAAQLEFWKSCGLQDEPGYLLLEQTVNTFLAELTKKLDC